MATIALELSGYGTVLHNRVSGFEDPEPESVPGLRNEFDDRGCVRGWDLAR